ncbi:MAG: thermonuclease family protein [Geminicoccaceae bacterium]
MLDIIKTARALSLTGPLMTASVALLLVSEARAEISGPPTIIDGDSLVIAGQRLDLHGIDAPEIGVICTKPDGKAFDCGRVARTALLDLTAGALVICQPVGPLEQDRPATARCTAGGFSLSRNMVHTGWAVADRHTAESLVAVEEAARAKQRGFWRWTITPPPWLPADR